MSEAARTVTVQLNAGARVKAGDTLQTGVIGPHTVQSLTTEWRAYGMNVWGADRKSVV